MAKRETVTLTEADIQTVDAKALTRPVSAALAVAEGADRNDHRGKEEMSNQADLILPRIALAQRTSKQIEPGEKRIKGLELFQMFNSVTEDVYGNGPLNIIVVRATKRGMEFNDKNEVVDYNVPTAQKPNGEYIDDRLNFSTSSDGVTRLKPKATLFYEYLVVLADTMELAVLSMKGTQVKVARKLNTFQNIRPGAAWLGQYALTSTQEATNFGPVAQYAIRPNGVPSAEAIALAEMVFANTQSRTFRAADQEGLNSETGEDAIPF